MAVELPPIYPITDKKLAGKSTHLSILRELVRGGARLVQIRDKETPLRELLSDLRRCVEFSVLNGIQLILDDRCDLVLSVGAGGVHLGQEDLAPGAARRILGKTRVIGFSTHSLRQLKAANRLPVDYFGFGPIFPTSTKSSTYAPLGIKTLSRASRVSARPIVAIGGIGLNQVREVLEAGAASAAVISDLMRAQNLARRMERFLYEATEKAGSGSRKGRSPARDPAPR